MNRPRKNLFLGGLCMWLLFACGCGTGSTCVVTQYSPGHMTYRGSASVFDAACRKVLRDLSDKEQIDDNRTKYPHYGEGVSSHKTDGRIVAVESYLKTRDDQGAQYKVTTVKLGKREPVVMLECTAEDSNKLVNALNTEFAKRDIEVIQY